MIDPKKKKDKRRRGRKDGRSHDKKTFGGSQKSRTDKYSPDAMRATMSTGGGEPIPAHHKWTDERRVLQPRDPDTGQFAYNADAQMSRKYKYHGKGDAIPVSVRQYVLGTGIRKVRDLEGALKAGQKIKIGEDVWFVIEDMDLKKFVNFFRNYDEQAGENYADGEKLSNYMAMKRGRKSKREEASEGGIIDGDVTDLSALGSSSLKDISLKLLDRAKTFKPSAYEIPEEIVTRLDPSSKKYKRNKAINDALDSVTMQGLGSGAFTGGVHDPEEDFSWVDDADKDPDRFYNDNKEFFDEALNDFNAEMGTNYDAKRFVREYIDHMKKKRDSKNESADNKEEDDE